MIVKDVNKGGLGWSTSRFDQVDWKALDKVLSSKPENYGLVAFQVLEDHGSRIKYASYIDMGRTLRHYIDRV